MAMDLQRGWEDMMTKEMIYAYVPIVIGMLLVYIVITIKDWIES